MHSSGLSPGGSFGIGSPNMQDKYQQVIVLKSGVLDEQKKNSHLVEELNSAAQKLRKKEEEMDSLGFLNKQLQRRVDQLQESLELSQKQLHSRNQKHSNNNSNNFIAEPDPAIVEELHRKIDENVKLHAKIDDLTLQLTVQKRELGDKITSCEDRVDKVNADMQKLQREMADKQRQSSNEFEKLQSQFTQCQRDVQAKELSLTDLNKELEGMRRDNNLLTSLLKDSDEAVCAKDWSAFTAELCPTVIRMLKSLVDWHVYTEQRLRAAGSWTESASSKLRTCAASLRTVCSEIPNPELVSDDQLQRAAAALDVYSNHLRDLLPPLSAAFHAEHLSSEAVSLNSDICDYFSNSFIPYLATVTRLLQTDLKTTPSKSQLVSQVTEAVSQFYQSCRRLAELYTRKKEQEMSLHVSDDISKANNSCLSSLVTLTAKSNRVFTEIRDKSELIQSRILFSTHTLSPAHAVVTTSTRTASESDQHHLQERISLLENEILLKNEKMNLIQSNLEKQSQRTEKIEKEKEHWMLEYQVLSSRLSKSDLSSGTGDEAASSSRDSLTLQMVQKKLTSMTFVIKRVESQLLHSQIVARSSNQRLVLSITDNCRLKEEITRQAEELDLTRKNYEDQLAAISDHVTQLNSQLMQKQEELTSLSASMSSTVSKKRR